MNLLNCDRCDYTTMKAFNMRRHIDRHIHTYDKIRQVFLSADGTYKCGLHYHDIYFSSVYMLRNHYYFFHRGDDHDHLRDNGICK